MATLKYDKALQEHLNIGTGTATASYPAGGTFTGTQISLSSFAVGQARVDTTWDPGEIAAGGQVSTTVTVTGASFGDFCAAAFAADIQGLQISAAVSAANTVQVSLSNHTGSAVDLSSGTLRVIVFKAR